MFNCSLSKPTKDRYAREKWPEKLCGLVTLLANESCHAVLNIKQLPSFMHWDRGFLFQARAWMSVRASSVFVFCVCIGL
jgi:hypothetical protein